MEATADGILSNSAAGDTFGEAVSSAGDFNGDGFSDILIGAPRDPGSGQAYLYFGGSGASLDPTPDVTLSGVVAMDSFGRAVSSAGDVNGDGLDDFLVGAPGDVINGSDQGFANLYFGASNGLPPASVKLRGSNHLFGVLVASLGDINNDGFADLAVSDSKPFLHASPDCTCTAPA